jgi:serine carboxypeptidase-like clade 2
LIFFRKQLNIPDDTAHLWDFCNDKLNQAYERDFAKGSLWAYKKHQNKYRMLKFSGDIDAVVPTLGTMRWIQELGWKLKKKWRPYFLNGMVAGYIEEHDGLTFATVRGAGHAVP